MRTMQPSNEYAERIVAQFRMIQRRFKDIMMKEVSRLNFTIPQMILLWELYEHPYITLNEMSKRMQLAKSTVSGIVDRLEAQGVVVREIPRENRRTVRLSISPEFLERNDVLRLKEGILSRLIENIDPEDAEKIIYAFDKLNELITNEKKAREGREGVE